MLYTIGHTKSYEQMFDENPPEDCVKIGRRYKPWRKPGSDIWHDVYQGGIVFRTAEEAASVMPMGYSVYGLLCDETNVHDGYLLKDTQLVRL